MAYISYDAPPIWLASRRLDRRITAGEYTYFDKVITFACWRNDDRVNIGRFCSLARNCVIFGGGNHFTERITTYPFQIFGARCDLAQSDGDVAPSNITTIGNDVWLGEGVRVMPGATVGDGAVIGAGTVIAGDVPPYAVVAGNPGRVVRRRFADDVVEKLLSLEWWNWPIEKILANVDLLLSDAKELPAQPEYRAALNGEIKFPVIPSRLDRLGRLLSRGRGKD